MCPLRKVVLVAALTVALGAATLGVLVSGGETLDRLHRVVAPAVAPAVAPVVVPKSRPRAPARAAAPAAPAAPDLSTEYEGRFRELP
jgi:hypothetical protein